MRFFFILLSFLLLNLSAPFTLHSQYIVKFNKAAESEQNSVNIFPNPNNGFFNYTLEGDITNLNIELSIYSLLGANLKSKIITPTNNLFHGNIDLSNYPIGLYVFHVNWDIISVTTLKAKSILANSAIVKGEIQTKKAIVLEKGFLITDNFQFNQFIKTNSNNREGLYFDTIRNLMPNTIYSYKAYAVFDNDTIFGGKKEFKTRHEIPFSLYSESEEFPYQEWNYKTLIENWQKLLDESPLECITEYNRVRLFVDLSHNTSTTNFLNRDLNIWTAKSDYEGDIPANTYRSSSVRAPLDLDYDLRYIRIGKGDLDDKNKPLFVIENCVHGGHESHNYRTAYFFIEKLFENWNEPWVQEFFDHHTILLFPMINIPGALGYGDQYGVFSYNNRNNINLNSNSGNKEEYPEYWKAVFNSLWRTRELARTHPYTPKPNTSLPNNAPEVIMYYNALQPNSEPEARAFEGVYKKLFDKGFNIGIVLDWHNNGHYRMYIDYFEERANGIADSFDDVFSDMLKRIWNSDNYPIEPNVYNESKLYRLLKTPIMRNDKFPLVVEIMENDNNPSNAIPFFDKVNSIDYVYINNEKFQLDKSDLNRNSTSLTLTKRFGNAYHPKGSKIESSIIMFESYRRVWKSGIGTRSTAYWHERYKNEHRITVEAPSTLRFLYDPPIWRTSKLLTSYYIATTLSFMHLSPYYDN